MGTPPLIVFSLSRVSRREAHAITAEGLFRGNIWVRLLLLCSLSLEYPDVKRMLLLQKAFSEVIYTYVYINVYYVYIYIHMYIMHICIICIRV